MKFKLMSTFEKAMLISFTAVVGVSLVAIVIGILQHI